MAGLLTFAQIVVFMVKYTRHSLKKLEALFEEIDYTVRYEKGNFNSGYAIVEDRNIIVINKFYEVEGRINVLLDILSQIEVPVEQLEEKSAKFYKQLHRSVLKEEE
jgi:hypothetical protein